MSESREVYVLGRFRPSEFSPDVIEREIRSYLPVCCRRERISVRVPQGIAPHPDNLQWHQDGGGPAGTTRHMVVWASEQPTEIRATNQGAISRIAPFDVVWFDNDRCWHRQPAGTDETRRWFVSIRCSGAL